MISVLGQGRAVEMIPVLDFCLYSGIIIVIFCFFFFIFIFFDLDSLLGGDRAILLSKTASTPSPHLSISFTRCIALLSWELP